MTPEPTMMRTVTPDPIIRYLGAPWSWSIEYDRESGCWLATIAELPDFFAAGDTSGEAAFNAREALISHISGYVATGTPIPVPAPKTRSGSQTDDVLTTSLPEFEHVA